MKKELYRSFEGKLDVGNEEGYIIYNIGDGRLQIEHYNVWTHGPQEPFRIPSKLLPPEDYGNEAKIVELCVDAWYGRRAGTEIYFRNRWYSDEAIEKIQALHEDNVWQKYV